MLILHASYRDGGLLLWGERPRSDEASRSPRKRKTKLDVPSSKPGIAAERSPFDAGEEALRDALSKAGGRSETVLTDALLWLPTVGAAPLASSPLIASPPEDASEPFLRSWALTALILPIEDAMSLLLGCADGDAPTGAVYGPSLAYWTTAMRFAGALVARQRFLPSVESVAGEWRARWEPVFIGPDMDRKSALANAMPAACRAVSARAETPPDAPAEKSLVAFIADVCDTLVRAEAVTDAALAPAPKTKRARSSKSPSFDSLHDHWLHALRSSDPVMRGDAEALADFAAQVREWRRPLSLSVAAPFRLCFRLEEPIPDEEAEDGEESSLQDDGAWRVRYLLQSAKDPSLLIPASEAWSACGTSAQWIRREGLDPREYLLSSLGEASKISDQVESSLKSAAPGGYDLDAAGAYEFLTEQAWQLEQAGFGAMLPAWWTRMGGKRRLTARASVKSPKMQSRAGLSLDAIVEVDWEAALGGEKLSLQELEALARSRRRWCGSEANGWS
jgi:hypothetical protein